MGFLKKIVEWIRGAGEEQPTAQQPTVSETTTSALTAKAVPVPDASDFERLVDSSTKKFVEDLRSLRSVTDNFEQAKTELLKELRNLSPKKRPGTAR